MRSLLRSNSAEVSTDIHTITTKELQVYGLLISTSQSHHTKLSRLSETPDHYDSIKDFIAYGSVYKTVLDAVQDENWED
jgi:hypothetical protein